MNKEGDQRGAKEEKYKEKEEVNKRWLFVAPVASKRPSIMREVVKGGGNCPWEQIRKHCNLRYVENQKEESSVNDKSCRTHNEPSRSAHIEDLFDHV